MSTAAAVGGGDGGAGGGAGGGGGAATPFYDGFQNAEVKALMATKQYADPEQLGIAYYNLNKLQNGARDVVAIPGEKATPEDWAKVHTAFGRPEAADKYDLKFGEGTKVDEPFVGFAKGLFFELGLDPKRAQLATDKWNEFVASRVTQIATEDKTKSDADLATLKTTWGKDWDAHVAAGQKAVKGLGLTDVELGQLDKAMSFPTVMKLLAAVGKGIGKEDSTIIDPKAPEGMRGVDTPEQARVRITELSADTAFQDSMRDTKNVAKREAAVALWGALHAKAYPEVPRA